MVEHSEQGATIKTLGDAFWWTISTVTLATYGDVYPVTAVGKIIAALLMFSGLTIFGVFISTVGTKMVESRLTKSRIGLMDETKSLIKNRIDIMEKLTCEDFDDSYFEYEKPSLYVVGKREEGQSRKIING